MQYKRAACGGTYTQAPINFSKLSEHTTAEDLSRAVKKLEKKPCILTLGSLPVMSTNWNRWSPCTNSPYSGQPTWHIDSLQVTTIDPEHSFVMSQITPSVHWVNTLPNLHMHWWQCLWPSEAASFISSLPGHTLLQDFTPINFALRSGV